MATAGSVQAPQTGVTDVINLINALGGRTGTTTTTQSPADIAGLQALQQQLQGADYNALLQSIFQQAGQQIPGLMAASSRAVGARTARNSGIDAAMQNLLKATTIEAQSKIAQQQLQNQQIQAQAGQTVAQATKGTTETQKKSEGLNLQRTAAMLALLQAATKLTGSDTVQDMVGKITGSAKTPAQQPMAAQTQAAPQAAASISSAPTARAAATPGMAAAPAAAVPVVDYSRPAMLEPSLQLMSPVLTPSMQETISTSPQGAFLGEDYSFMPAAQPMPVSDFGANAMSTFELPPVPNIVQGYDIMNFGL